MGIVSSTFASLAIRLAWNCQRLLDPQYRCLEQKRTLEISSNIINKQSSNDNESEAIDLAMNQSSIDKQRNLKINDGTRGRNLPLKSGRQQRYRKRRTASFDTALITKRSDNQSNLTIVSNPISNTCIHLQGRPQPMFWDVTSSSGCSSDSGSNLDSDSEIESRLHIAFMKKKTKEKSNHDDPTVNTEDEKEENFSMSAEEETALRMTVGRGHFSRSKKDRFLNHLRLEKRLNGLNNYYSFTGSTDQLGRRYSGDLYKVPY